MDKLDCSKLGGDPLSLDDLEFLQTSLAEAIKGLASVWQWGSSDPVVIAGIKATVGVSDTVYTSGYVVIQQEVYFVSGVTVPNGSSMCIDIAQTFDAAGDETFEDLSTQQTYIIRRGTLKIPVGGPSEMDITDFISVKDALSTQGIVVNNETAWANATFSGAWASATGGFYGSNAVRYRKNKLGNIELDGIAYCAASPSAAIIFVLPVGFRPACFKVYPAYVGDTGSGALVGWVIIEPNGDVSLFTQVPGTYDLTVSLCGITIPV
jgi:hypothetical protein